MANNRKKPTLPILSYYLTFIHYFGFSINPNDDTSSRYLSIRVKRARASPTLDDVINATKRKHNAASHHPDQWLASYKVRAQRTFSSIPMLLIRLLRTSVKFTAIAFTTFIALNHCIVLADYIYQGSKVFLELMLEVRLVITKFSALIFVLSWHFNQTKVRQLIKLVKSTSVYIIGTQSTTTSQQWKLAATPVAASAGMVELRALHEPTNTSPPTSSSKLTLERQQTTCRHSEDILEGCEDDDDDNDGDDDDDATSQEVNEVEGESAGGGEIGDTLLMNINYMDRRFLNWWLMCVCVSILHFSLSEVELSKSNHLWQWLDDYSMHQLNNQTIGQSTLLFLASFDNYIYTVHVYGTRLIGASIICIVCTLQRENIASLRLHALQLIRQLPQQQQQQQHSPADQQTCFMKSRNTWLTHNTSSDIKPAKSSPPSNSESESKASWKCKSTSTSEESTTTQQQPAKVELSCDDIDRELFFVLGESDWLRVYESARNSRPSGYLSSTIHRGSRSLLCVARKRFLWLWWWCVFKGKGGGGGTTLTRLCCNILMRRTSNRVGSSSLQHHHPQAAAAAAGIEATATPTPTATAAPRCMTSLEQIASSIMLKSRGGGNRGGGGFRHTRSSHHLRWPTPISEPSQPKVAAFRDKSVPSKQQQQSSEVFASSINGSGYEGKGTGKTPQRGCKSHSSSSSSIEGQLERLASKYELVRTVNARIDSCFGPMLLIQYSFLFLMSCIDVVYFSICFNPNTKTKYIIISGMILLWWPYLLLYKFASDIGSESKELLISVRRLARLWLLEHHNRCLNHPIQISPPSSSQQPAEYDSNIDRSRNYNFREGCGNMNCNKFSSNNDNKLTYSSSSSHDNYVGDSRYCSSLLNNGFRNRRDKTPTIRQQEWPFVRPLTKRFWPATGGALNTTITVDRSYLQAAHIPTISETTSQRQARACIINKLDHVFKPTYLSIMGIMTVDKFFLLNFAKIVITASVMIIQFIT